MVIIVLIVIIVFIVQIKRKKKPSESFSLLNRPNSTIQTISVSVLERIGIFNLLQCKFFSGGGNFGDVFRGKWQGTEVALKRLKSNDAMDEFKREATMLSALNHPNVVHSH